MSAKRNPMHLCSALKQRRIHKAVPSVGVHISLTTCNSNKDKTMIATVRFLDVSALPKPGVYAREVQMLLLRPLPLSLARIIRCRVSNPQKDG